MAKKYIDADKLKAEIERRKEEYKKDRYMSDYRGQIAYYKDEIYDDLLSFIDSLQQEQSTEDLKVEEEIEKYMDIRGLIWYDDINLSDFARHFYELGKQSKEPVSEDLKEAAEKYAYQGIPEEMKSKLKPIGDEVIKNFKAGAEWQKEQMLKDAVEGVARPDDCEIWVNLVGYGYKFNDGDKIKIVVIPNKEDKE